MPFCRKCGNAINVTDRVCNKCGTSVAHESLSSEDSGAFEKQTPVKAECCPERVPALSGLFRKNRTFVIAVVVLSIVFVSLLTVMMVILVNNANSSNDNVLNPEENSGSKKVGIAFPDEEQDRWVRDGDYLKQELETKGYEVELQYAGNDVSTQLTQIEEMIDQDCDVLVIAAVEGSSLGEALDLAEDNGISVIAYDCLIMESETVDYYVTFDNYMVGTVQGLYIEYALDLQNAEGPFNLEITAGDIDDSSAELFYEGAMDVLMPYIDEGKLIVVSGQVDFSDVATEAWAETNAQTRAETIINQYYSSGLNIDAWLCSNDSTALGVENALASYYAGTYPEITGQDCNIANVINIVSGKQSMSVFKDTRILAYQTIVMINQIYTGETVDTNNTELYDNGKIVVPAYLCEPVYVDAANFEAVLIDSGFYSKEDLTAQEPGSVSQEPDSTEQETDPIVVETETSGTEPEVTETSTQEAAPEEQGVEISLDEETIRLAIINYLTATEYDWDTAAKVDGPDGNGAGWGPDTQMEGDMYVTTYQAYTGAIISYYTDSSGYTYETEYGAFNGFEESPSGVDFYIQDYIF